MKSKDSWLQDILSTTSASAQRGYEIIRALRAQEPTVGPQILEELIQQGESYYQMLGLYGMSLLALPKWEPRVLELAQHSDPQVKNSALRTLGFVGTRMSTVTLLTLARQNYDGAAWALKKHLDRFPEFSPQIFTLANELLFSENAQVREQAVAIIIKLEMAQQAEAALVKSTERFADEFTLDALKGASKAILPRLKKLKAQFTPEGAEYQDIERTIYALEERHKAMVPEMA